MMPIAQVPEQADLLAQLDQSNRRAVGWQVVLGCASVALAVAIDWQRVAAEPVYSLVVLGLVPIQYLPGLAGILLKKKKRVEELSEGFRAGIFNKPKLLSTIRETAQALGVELRRVPVYLTRDKDLNAYAVSVGLSRWIPSIRGVYINRQTLHVSTESGLRSTIGHELGHLFPYQSKWQEGLLVKFICGGLLSLFVLQQTGAPSSWGFIMAVAVAWGFLFLNGLPQAQIAQTIEFLCDGLGARAAGVEAAISDLLNFGNECQAQYELSIAALKLAGQGRAINDAEAMKIYEDALGYGPTDVDSTLARIHEAVEKEKVADRRLSVKGLVDFFWRDNVADSGLAEARDEAIVLYEKIDALPKIDWKAVTQWQPDEVLSEQQIQRLVDEMVAHPDHLLFTLPSEPAALDSQSHPSFRRRLLYLWMNRSAIEQLRPSDGWRAN